MLLRKLVHLSPGIVLPEACGARATFDVRYRTDHISEPCLSTKRALRAFGQVGLLMAGECARVWEGSGTNLACTQVRKRHIVSDLSIRNQYESSVAGLTGVPRLRCGSADEAYAADPYNSNLAAVRDHPLHVCGSRGFISTASVVTLRSPAGIVAADVLWISDCHEDLHKPARVAPVSAAILGKSRGFVHAGHVNTRAEQAPTRLNESFPLYFLSTCPRRPVEELEHLAAATVPATASSAADAVRRVPCTPTTTPASTDAIFAARARSSGPLVGRELMPLAPVAATRAAPPHRERERD